MPSGYWKSLEEREHPEHPDVEVAEFTSAPGDAGPTRRNFLRLAGFSMAGAIAACNRAPVRRAIPYVSQPDGIVPGRALWFATTCGGCAAGCGLLVKARDGRPIKIEGCPDHPLSAGGVCAVGQASLLGLYDSLRFRGPQLRGAAATWAAVDADLRQRLDAIRRAGGAVRILTGTVHSPSVRRAIERFIASVPDAVHVEYDAISASAILDAHQATHGIRALPRYRFDRADVIVGFDADFLGTWISPSEFTAGYTRRRRPEAGPIAWHAQVESRVSITGGKADRRIALAPDEIDALVFDVADLVERGASGTGPAGALAERLLAAKGRSLAVCGRQSLDAQVSCNRINQALGNYGSTLDLDTPSQQRRGDDRAVARLLEDARQGRIAALLVWHANPLLDLPGAEALRRVPLIVSFAERRDDTSDAAHVICPDHHQLESWGDSEPVAGAVGLTQPLVHPLGQTRAFMESLAVLSGESKPAADLLRETWRERVFTRQSAEPDFTRFWDAAVQRGFAVVTPTTPGLNPATPGLKAGPTAVRADAVVGPAFRPGVSGAFRSGVSGPRRAVAPDALHLVLYHKAAMFAGEHAYNPLLQELPDPITKAVWDNYASIAPALAEKLQLADGDVVRVEAGGRATELPVLVQPGQHERTVAIALGYGSVMTERFKDLGHYWFRSRPTVGDNGRVGVNAAMFLRFDGQVLRTDLPGITLTRTGSTRRLACTQSHHTLTVPARLAPAGGEHRPIVQEIAASALPHVERQPDEQPADLWPADHPATGHRWGMAIDLNACTGCAACIVGCQIENNIPVVGRDEVGRNREMHWLRIDRYYSEDDDGLHVASQPMLCQQCEHAPCETVCPTLATLHSAEGLNQQVYNRCVGTRYCLNNCPYKTRRFNWFQYARDAGTEHLMLNPDVTVRSRGVMEKCTFCVQRIQEAKIEALGRGEPVRDGDIQTACQQSCAAQAIVFGDLNDPNSRVSKAASGARGYKVLEELNVRPAITYLKVVRQGNVAAAESAHHG